MTASELLDVAAARLRAAKIESPRLEARLMLAHAIGAPADSMIVAPMSRHDPDPHTIQRFHELVDRRVAREPLAYIVGKKEFWSLEFAVGPGVLVPRPESETLVEQALFAFPNRDARLTVLDLGTGSGCLLLAFLSERPNAPGFGVDMSDPALNYARANAAALGLADRSGFIRRDWSIKADGLFDVVFCNPPYLSEDDLAMVPPELRVEPLAALAGGRDGLDAYRALASFLPRLLTVQGRAFVEIGRGQVNAVESIFSSAALETIAMAHDLSGIPRCLVLAAAREVRQKAVGNPKESG